MAVHVLGNDDAVVDHDTHHKNQSEQRDPVERITQQIVAEERQRKSERYREEHHEAAAPSHRKHDQNGDGDDCDAQMQQQFAYFFGCRLAIVAGHLNMDIIGDERLFQFVDAFKDGV